MAHTNLIRNKIEKRIIADVDKVKINPETGCYKDAELDEYFELWRVLIIYYQDHTDFDISVEIVREYLDIVNEFYRASNQVELGSECRETARESLRIIETYMEAIIAAVERRIYPHGR